MVQTNGRYQRKVRNLFIHKEMQREFSFVLIALLVASSLLIAGTIHWTIQHAAFGDGALQFGRVNPYQVIAEVTYQIITRVTMILLLTLVTIAVYGIKFLHRVAGPIYRCRKTMIVLNQGKIPEQIRLRSGDFFTELADEINRQSNLWEQEVLKKEELARQIDALCGASANEDVKSKLVEIKNWI